MASLPPLQAIQSCSHAESPLAIALTTLFEYSPILISRLEPELATSFRSGSEISSYPDLIHLALAYIEAWDVESQAVFIKGHPRIGESDKLSRLSAKEQGAQGITPTSPEVLGRLAHLNQCYETLYPGLRYITFVNGRSRAEILGEMENAMDFVHSLSPSSPALEDLVPVDVTSEAWRSELTRAIRDVGRIAQSRLKALGI
jgi:2-oxo-4-hydroxy-4-carboxy--5-ureidoimidazoline (OHCU) decarboxylase